MRPLERWVCAAINEMHRNMHVLERANPVSGEHLHHDFLQQIPDADAVLLEDIGHYPQTEAPGAVVAAFLDFHRKHKVLT